MYVIKNMYIYIKQTKYSLKTINYVSLKINMINVIDEH